MKTKKLTLGFLSVVGFLLLISAAVTNTQNGSQVLAQMCQANPVRCVVPQNVSKSPLRPW